ncbi:major facilitator superfamily transporter [Phlyctema vagabunda]|uniref:Major facilitator superfamily transporter n=1 Tax=Phlyctema vagabunda TaxID=108571 RepID=A0ABR4PH01_9HELO
MATHRNESSTPTIVSSRQDQATTDPEKGDTAEKTRRVEDWDGNDDPGNPLNWSRQKRYFQIVPAALASFTASFGSSIYTPAFTEVMRAFDVGSTTALLPLSLYVLALGAGPIISAPLSETYGRRVVYLLSTPLGALFTMGAGFAQNMATLCILRFFAGLTFSSALAIGAGTIADVNAPEHRAVPSTFYIIMPFLGPTFGPVIGAFVAVRKGWRWTQWTLIFFAILTILVTLFASETHKKTILLRRAKKLKIPPLPSPFPNKIAKIKFFATVTLIRPLHMLLTEPIVGFLSLYTAFNFAILFSFFAAFPYVFRTVYGFTVEESGLVFLSIGIGCILAVPTVLLCDHFLYQPQVRLSHSTGSNGTVAPEYRLYPAMIGSIGLPIALFWFAWTARPSISWASPVVAAIPFAWGNLSVFIGSAMYLVDTYQALTGASALAANGLLRYLLGAVFPLFTLQMYRALSVHWATSLLGFISVLLMPIPWVIFKYGKAIRNRSRYDTLKA